MVRGGFSVFFCGVFSVFFCGRFLAILCAGFCALLCVRFWAILRAAFSCFCVSVFRLGWLVPGFMGNPVLGCQADEIVFVTKFPGFFVSVFLPFSRRFFCGLRVCHLSSRDGRRPSGFSISSGVSNALVLDLPIPARAACGDPGNAYRLRVPKLGGAGPARSAS